MRILARHGLSAQTVAEWGAVTDDFDRLHATAQLMKRAVAAAYNEADWLSSPGS